LGNSAKDRIVAGAQSSSLPCVYSIEQQSFNGDSKMHQNQYRDIYITNCGEKFSTSVDGKRHEDHCDACLGIDDLHGLDDHAEGNYGTAAPNSVVRRQCGRLFQVGGSPYALQLGDRVIADKVPEGKELRFGWYVALAEVNA